MKILFIDKESSFFLNIKINLLIFDNFILFLFRFRKTTEIHQIPGQHFIDIAVRVNFCYPKNLFT